MRKTLSWKNLLIILLASMFLGAGLRTSKDVGFLFWATFVDMFSYLVLALLIIASCREAIRKYRNRKGSGELVEKKIENNLDDPFFKKLSEFYKKGLSQILILFKKYWRVLILSLFVISIIAGAFYWYEWRPTQIRKRCSVNFLVSFKISRIFLSPAEKERDYEDCLRMNGLEK